MAASNSHVAPPSFTHGPGPRFQIAFAGWSKEFAVPVSFQEGIVRTARAVHRFTGKIQDLVESQVSPASDSILPKSTQAKSDIHEQVARMQDEGGNAASGTAPYLKRAQ
jgi:hypothetical protein